MSMGKRILLATLAWLVTHFTLHIAFAAVYDNVPDGFIALVDFCVAGTVLYITREKDKN